MARLVLDEYYRYDRLTEELENLTEAFAPLVSLHSAGKSYEGRDIWAVTLTNPETGEHDTKPALYMDGNIHAGEVTGSMLCLYTIHYLASRFDSDPDVKRLLDTRTIYIIPRVNPDGAEKYLTTPHYLRSSVRVYPPYQEDDPEGLDPEDINGDGHILQMRIRDDDLGEWKPHHQDDRLMVRRRPDDHCGPFYRLLPEGMFRDDPALIRPHRWPLQPARTRWGLDLNRNFPAEWNPKIRGAGPYPLSEPETRAQVEFIVARPNIGAVLAFHTTGGLIFRPPSTRADDSIDPGDLELLQALGHRGQELTGYPCVPTYGPQWSGALDDWAYDQRGVISYTPELWNMATRAGIALPDFTRRRPYDPDTEAEHGLKLLAWNDRELAGEGFVPWTPFDHTQLGTVEIGGWLPKTVMQNPPLGFLPGECHKNSMFALAVAASLPRVSIDRLQSRLLGPGVWLIECDLCNRGYLSTAITRRAVDLKLVGPDRVELVLDDNLKLATGRRRQEIPHLDGYAAGQGRGWWGAPSPARSSVHLEWIVAGEPGRSITVRFTSDRGGTVSRKIDLAAESQAAAAADES